MNAGGLEADLRLRRGERALRGRVDLHAVEVATERRSPLRWAAHAGIFWGCILAAVVTFPLSFGWIRFETARDSQEV